MNRTAARLPLAAALAAAASLALASCAGSPDLAIVSPVPGSTLGAALDLDPNTPGLQVAVDATTSAIDGSDATAVGGGAPVHAVAHGGHIHFPSVTLADGASRLTVSVVDHRHDKTAVATTTYSVDSFESGCRITTPANATVFGGDPGDTGLVSVVVEAVCRGLAPGVQVGLLENDDSARTQLQSPNLDGSVSFNADLIPGSNLLAVVAPGVAYDVVEVTLASSRCRVELSPPSGSSFNLAGNNGAYADADPSTAGVQAAISVKTDCADGAPAHLAILHAGVPVISTSSSISGGAATFDVTLPDGALDVQAFVGAPGTEGASRHAAYTSDGTDPSVVVLSPTSGSLLTAQNNVGDGVEFTARIRGEVGSLDTGGTAALEFDQGTPDEQEVLVAPDATTDIFSADVALAPGPHKLVAKAIRASGNTSTSAEVDFTVVSSGSALVISAPASGSTIGLSQVTPEGGGSAQVIFVVQSAGLEGSSVSINCGSNLSASGTIDASGNASVPLTLPVQSCSGALFRCTASSTSVAGSVVSSPSTFTVDATAPQVFITEPSTIATNSSSITVQATTSCPNEGQIFTLDNGGTVVATGSVQANAISVSGVPLNPGLNTLHLTVTDAALNSGSASTGITLLTGTPNIVITSPAANATLTSASASVTVQVDNRPVPSAVQLFVSDAAGARSPLTANTAVVGGHNVATFSNVALPEGPDTLTASVTDPVPNAVATTAAINVTVNTGHALCDVVVPADGTAWTGADDSDSSTPGFQHDMSVSTTATGKVTLTVALQGGASQSIDDNGTGDGTARTVTFPGVTLPADGSYTVSAVCNGTPSGASLPNALSYAANGPSVAFVSPADGATLNNASFSGNGTATVQVSSNSAGQGGTVSLTATCGSTVTFTGSATFTSGAASFQVPLLGAGQSGSCTLKAQAQTAAGAKGVADSITVNVDRLSPSLAFVSPTSGQAFTPSSSQITCGSPSAAPVLNQVQLQVSSDTVAASGMALSLTNSGGTQEVAQTPSYASGVFTWTNVQLAADSNTLSATATDADGNASTASVTFTARCSSNTVTLSMGTKFGYAQDKDHSLPGVQISVEVDSNAATNSPVRLCSTANVSSPNASQCSTPGTGPLTVISGNTVIASGFAVFTVTIPNGPQTVYAEVTDEGVDVSAGKTLTARDTPPTVVSIATPADTEGATVSSGPDGALNQAELDATNGTVNFKVVFGTNSFVAGQTVQILSTASSSVLGSAVVAQNGDGSTATTVAVPTASINTGGYESYTFYAKVSDDAGNVDSTPAASVAGVAATTLGTSSVPFVIAPTPTIQMSSPSQGTSSLNASNDVRCANGTCPDTDPLVYDFAANTNAPDNSLANTNLHSQITFLEGGSAIGTMLGRGETNPTNTTGQQVSSVELPIANNPAAVLAAQVADPYGNVATSATLTLTVDSVPPALTISQVDGQSTSSLVTISEPTVNAVVSIDPSGPLESGQTVTIYSDGTAIGNGVANGGSSLTISIAVPQSITPHSLVAKATDKAGNAGTSAAVSVLQTYAGPTLALSTPSPVPNGTLWFGFNTPGDTSSSTSCTPTLTFSTTSVPDGQNVSAWLVAANGACSSTVPGSGVTTGTVASGSATLTHAFTIADGNSGKLCAEVSDGLGNTAILPSPQAFQCDVQKPTVSWVLPAANSNFVGNGQTVTNATSSTSTSTTQLGLTSTPSTPAVQLKVLAPSGGTLVLTVNQNASTEFQFVSCAISAASTQQTIDALSSNNCSATSGNGQLLLNVDYAQALAHTLNAVLTATSGNVSTTASESVNIDVAEPSAVTPTVSMKQAIGVANVTIPTVPDDDQSNAASGAPVSWEVRYATSSAAALATSWSSGTLISANLAGPFPTGVPTTFQVVLPAGNPNLFLGVRAVDRAGNLGDIAAGNIVQVSSDPVGSVISIVDDSGSAPSAAGDEQMRTADLNGDGYDDVILAYPSAHTSDGRIVIYFGGAGGVSNSAAPLVLSGKTTGTETLGFGQAFDVGDFDGDGLMDIAIGESDYTAIGHVLIWTGASIKAWITNGSKAASPPTPIILDESGPSASGKFVGGTIRAVKQLSGSTCTGAHCATSGSGDDLAITSFWEQDGSSGNVIAILHRGDDWSINGSSGILSAAATTIVLPDTIASGASTTDDCVVEAAPFSYGSTPVGGVLASIVDPVSNAHEIRVFNISTGNLVGDVGASFGWSAGTSLPDPAGVPAADLFGYVMAGGRDAVGDSNNDVVIGRLSHDYGSFFLYDGDDLASPATARPIEFSAALDGNNPAHCAELLPDLDGDNKAEVSGCELVTSSAPVYVWFGSSETTTQLAAGQTPPLPLIPATPPSCAVPGSSCTPVGRGQHIANGPSGFSGVPGQAVGAGHVTALVGRDLVILSKTNGEADTLLVER